MRTIHFFTFFSLLLGFNSCVSNPDLEGNCSIETQVIDVPIDLPDLKKALLDCQKIARLISEKYPPDKYYYLAMGRSPLGIITFLELKYPDNASSIPLSSFRFNLNYPDSSIDNQFRLDKESREFVFLSKQKLTAEQKEMLDIHFEEFLPKLEKGKQILLIDYCASAKSLISAQLHIKRYLLEHELSNKVLGLGCLHRVDEEILINTLNSYLGKEKAQRWLDNLDFIRLEAYPELCTVFHYCLFDSYSPYGSFNIRSYTMQNFLQNRPKKNQYLSEFKTNYLRLKEIVLEIENPNPLN